MCNDDAVWCTLCFYDALVCCSSAAHVSGALETEDVRLSCTVPDLDLLGALLLDPAGFFN